MQMVVLPGSGGFTTVAPMLFTSQLTLAIPDSQHNGWEIQKKKLGKLLFNRAIVNRDKPLVLCYHNIVCE
jgi:hypothetical protein